MAEWRMITVDPLDAPTLSGPSPGGAGVHGPAVRMASLSYPRPSMLAGFLASMAYRLGPVGDVPEPRRGFEDLEHLLGRLGVEALRPGLLVGGRGELYAYLGTRFLPSLDCLARRLASYSGGGRPSLRDIMRDILGGGCRGVVAAIESYTGIALDRDSKSVRESLIYERERITYRPRASIAVLARTRGTTLTQAIHTLGADRAVIKLQTVDPPGPPSSLLVHGEGERWLLVLLSPALLEAGRASKILEKAPLLDSGLHASLARLLLEGHECTGRAEAVVVPRNEYILQVVLPGWSSLLNGGRGGYRRPHIEVPPGTVLHAEADKACIEGIVESGVGLHSRLGWGTVLAVAVG